MIDWLVSYNRWLNVNVHAKRLNANDNSSAFSFKYNLRVPLVQTWSHKTFQLNIDCFLVKFTFLYIIDSFTLLLFQYIIYMVERKVLVCRREHVCLNCSQYPLTSARRSVYLKQPSKFSTNHTTPSSKSHTRTPLVYYLPWTNRTVGRLRTVYTTG